MKAPVPTIATTYTYTDEAIIDCENGIDTTLSANIIIDEFTDTIVLENIPQRGNPSEVPPPNERLCVWNFIIIVSIIVLLICFIGLYNPK